MILLINKSSEVDNEELHWGWSSYGMDCENRKLMISDARPEGWWHEESDHFLAAHDGLWGYRYEDTIPLKRRE